MSSQTLLSSGDKYYAYSGITFGDISVPASIPLINIPNTGLRDSFIDIQPIFGTLVSNAVGSSLGIQVEIDNNVVLTCDQFSVTNWGGTQLSTNQLLRYSLFVPRQSKLVITSLNTSANNTQERGCNILGYYL
tara:strand:- start:104 stop:502 length:399 start_codon:yes stop_codon:yes gene_type:complete